MAVPFDPVRQDLTGMPAAIFSSVMQVERLRNSTVANVVPHISFSVSGAMAYVPAHPQSRQSALVWVDRTGTEQPTGASGGTYFQPRLSPDGRRLAVTVLGDRDDVWLYDLTRQTWSRFTSEGNNSFPLWSPDGRSVAYGSSESGRIEIYLRPYPAAGEKLTISTEGGNEPVWSADSRELFYRNGDAMMVVDVTTAPILTAGKPRRLFEKRYEPTVAMWANYDVTRDGQRFIMVKRIDREESAQINVVLNWGDELKRLAPGRSER